MYAEKLNRESFSPDKQIQRPRSLKGVTVTAYTCEAVRTIFVELFCTPKSSLENPSLRVNRYSDPALRFCSLYSQLKMVLRKNLDSGQQMS